jgi:hypothetical protein
MLNLIAGSMAATVVLLLVFMIFGFVRPPATPGPAVIAPILGVIGILQLFGAAAIESRLKRRAPGAAGAASIIAFGLREAVAVYGLITYAVTGDFFWSVGLAGAALVAMILGWPRGGGPEGSP